MNNYIVNVKIYLLKITKEMIQMALIPYDPFRQLTNIRRDFDRLFNDFLFI